MVIINIFYNYLPTRGYHDHDGQINTDRSSGFHGWNFPMASVSLFDVSAPERWIVLVRRWMLWKSYEIIHVSYIYNTYIHIIIYIYIIRVCVSYSYHIIISSYHHISSYTPKRKRRQWHLFGCLVRSISTVGSVFLLIQKCWTKSRLNHSKEFFDISHGGGVGATPIPQCKLPFQTALGGSKLLLSCPADKTW